MSRLLRRLATATVTASLVLLTACSGAPAATPPATMPASSLPPATETPSPTLEPTPTQIASPTVQNWFGEVPTDARGCPITAEGTQEFLVAEPSVIGADSLPDGLCLYDSKYYDTFAILPVQPSPEFPQQVLDWLEPQGWSFFDAEPGPFHYRSVNKAPVDVQDLYEFDGSIDGAIIAVDAIAAEDLDSRGITLNLLRDTFGAIEPGDPVYFAAIWW